MTSTPPSFEIAADAFEIVLADGRKMGMKVRRWDRPTWDGMGKAVR